MLNPRSITIVCCLAGPLAASGFIALEAQQPSAGAPVPSAAHRDVINRYCVSCHNDRLKRGGLALDTVAADDVGRNPEVWEKVLRKVRARQMPPVGLPRPNEATYQATISSLEQSLDRAAGLCDTPGSPKKPASETKPINAEKNKGSFDNPSAYRRIG